MTVTRNNGLLCLAGDRKDAKEMAAPVLPRGFHSEGAKPADLSSPIRQLPAPAGWVGTGDRASIFVGC